MEENKNCGCGCDHEAQEGCDCGHEEESIIYVTFEDEDKEVPCTVLSIFECGDLEYIALAPKEEVENADEAEVLFYRFKEDGDEVQLDEVESDEEWGRVAEVFDDLFFGDEDWDEE